MAREKKTEKELTIEERLKQALVPAEEQPYSVPENWCWVRGAFLFKPMESKSPVGTVFRYIDIDSIDNKTQRVHQPKVLLVKNAPSRANRKVHDGDTLFSLVRPYLRNIAYVDESLSDCIASTGFYICTPVRGLDSHYLFYLMQSEYVISGLTCYMKGDNSPSIRKSDLEFFAYPLPPFDEQQHIVDRIESLFAKLDEAKEKAQAVVDGFETRKEAILHKAFTGELTAKWRQENQVGIDSWQCKKLFEISSLQTGLMKGKRYSEETVMLPYLRVANVQDGFLDLSEIKKIEVPIKQAERYKLKNGDVLFTEGGDFDKLGRGTVWTEEIENCLHQNHIFVVRPDTDLLNPYFLSYQAGSRYGKQYFLSCSKQTTNLASINSTQLKNFPTIVPTVGEQKMIVSIIDTLLAKEQQAKETAEAVLDQIEAMKKSILARAFRGDLGTNDPAEESAVELLKQAL